MPIYALPYPVFKPATRIISAITNDFPAVVTTTFDHGYIDGLIVRLIIPIGYGMQAANKLFGSITVTSPTEFKIDIDTRPFDPFVIPSVQKQQAQSVPFAEDNDILAGAVQNVLPY